MAANWIASDAPVVQRVRAYFSPVNRVSQAPTVFDAAAQGGFNLDAPPDPWIDLGWIDGFTRKVLSKTSSVLTGIPAAVQEQVRASVEAQVEFNFQSWTKLTMALSTGSQHMNLLAPASGSAPRDDGGQAIAAVAIQAGSTATSIALAPADSSKFSAGMLIAVDADYVGQTGYLGSPIAGAYLRQPLGDVDYVRRITFNVGLVTEVTTNGLTLAQPLVGGVPASGAKVQTICGFVDREGGCFFQEWSALFVMQGSQGERVFFHYPRLQPSGGAEEAFDPLTAKGKGTLERMVLRGRFMALPVTDALDGERVLCYRSFLPAANALV